MKIVVAVDGSTFAETVIPTALALAGSDGRLEFLSVFDRDSVLAGSEATAKQFKEWLGTHLADLVQRTRAVRPIDCGYAILDGDPAEVVCDYALRAGADFVAVTTHGRGPVSRSWLGSVADRVVHRVAVPTLVVRAREDENHDLAERVELRTLVVALDGSPLAEQSLVPTVRLAKRLGASITLLRIVEMPRPFAAGYLPHVIDATSSFQGAEDAAKEYLAGVETRVRQQGVTVDTLVVVGSSAAHDILAFLEESRADLVAIASHGRTGLSRVLMGSIADKVVRGATTPVLLTRAAAPEKLHWWQRLKEQALAT